MSVLLGENFVFSLSETVLKAAEQSGMSSGMQACGTDNNSLNIRVGKRKKERDGVEPSGIPILIYME